MPRARPKPVVVQAKEDVQTPRPSKAAQKNPAKSKTGKTPKSASKLASGTAAVEGSARPGRAAKRQAASALRRQAPRAAAAAESEEEDSEASLSDASDIEEPRVGARLLTMAPSQAHGVVSL